VIETTSYCDVDMWMNGWGQKLLGEKKCVSVAWVDFEMCIVLKVD
jgi:hypothetical protein